MKSKRPPRAHAHRRRGSAEAVPPVDLRWSLLVPTALVIVVAACYVPSLSGPFMMDDVYSRPGRLPGDWTSAWAPPQSPMAGRPIPNWSMMFCHHRFGDDPRPYRIFNLGLHAANALVLWGLVRRTLRLPSVGPLLNRLCNPTAAAIALIWAVHPLGTESVAYITQRTELFVAFFMLTTLYLNVRAVGSTFPELWLVGSAVACLLGMLSKEVMVAAPLLIVLYDRAFVFPTWREAFARRWWYYLASACTWIVLYRLMAPAPRSMSVGFGHDVTAPDYLKRQALAIAEYVRLAFWPTRQNLDHGDLRHPELPEGLLVRAYVYGAIILAAVVATAVALWRRPAWGFLGAWFFMILAPTSSFVPIITEWCAERRMYLPLMAIVAGVVVGAVQLIDRLANRGRADDTQDQHAAESESHDGGFRIVPWSPALLVVLVLAIATIRRAALYSDPVALWSETAALNPNSFRPQSNLAHMRYEAAIRLFESDPEGARREAEAARREYGRAIELAPDEAPLHYNYGKVSLLLNDKAEAERALRKAVELLPQYVKALGDLGNLLFEAGRFEEAAGQYQALMQLQPQSPLWPFNFGLAMKRQGRLDDAHEYFRRSAELQPAIAEIWAEYAESSWRKGEIEIAEHAVNVALSIEPNNARAVKVGREILALRQKARGHPN